MNDWKWATDLAHKLTEFANPESPDRAVLAHLRQGMRRHGGPWEAALAYPLARVGWLFSGVPNRPERLLNSAVLAAGLFAWVKGRCPQADCVNFGAAFGAGLTLKDKQQREKRFIDLLDTDTEELPYKLRQAITLVGRERDRVGLDWALLMRELCAWGSSTRWVQKKWAYQFWAAPERESIAASEQPSTN